GGTTYETIKLLLDTEPRQPQALNPRIDRDLSTICLKCLEKNPGRRYFSASALSEDLERWLKHEPIQARHTGAFTHGKNGCNAIQPVRSWRRRSLPLRARRDGSFRKVNLCDLHEQLASLCSLLKTLAKIKRTQVLPMVFRTTS